MNSHFEKYNNVFEKNVQVFIYVEITDFIWV